MHKSLTRYLNDEKKSVAVVRMITHFHDESSIDPLMEAWKLNQKLEDEIIPSIIKIYDVNNKSDKAYQAMISLKKAKRYYYGEEYTGLDDSLQRALVDDADASKINYLINFLNGPPIIVDYEVLDHVVERLAHIGDPPVVVPVIARLLKSPSAHRRMSASETLSKIGSNLAITPLEDALKVEKDIGVKINMTAQLVKLGEFLYLDEIIKVLEDKSWPMIHDQKIQSTATYWLQDATGQNFESNASAWRNWFEKEKVKRELK